MEAEVYFIRSIYVLTCDSNINVARVKSRESQGGHGVPEDKIISRYKKALDLIPELINVCDVMHIYDNSNVPFRIFKSARPNSFSGKMNIGMKRIFMIW